MDNKLNVIFITEYLNPPYDEGIKKTVYYIYKKLSESYNLKTFCKFGFEEKNIAIIKTNRLFFNYHLFKKIHKTNPQILIYLPFCSTTTASYLRFFILSLFSRCSKNILVALQPKPIKKWQKYILNISKISLALTPSLILKKFWESIDIDSELIPLYTDLNKFKLLDAPEQKLQLKKKYNLPLDKIIITHLGHLNKGRNLETLIPLQKAGFQVVIVNSTSTPKDAVGPLSIRNELIKEGIIIIDSYIKDVEEIYQLSDLYIFPVKEANSSIDLPLSILEARACGIPVLATAFGSVRYFLDDDSGGITYSEPHEFLDKIKMIEFTLKPATKVHSLNDKFLTVLNGVMN